MGTVWVKIEFLVFTYNDDQSKPVQFIELRHSTRQKSSTIQWNCVEIYFWVIIAARTNQVFDENLI